MQKAVLGYHVHGGVKNVTAALPSLRKYGFRACQIFLSNPLRKFTVPDIAALSRVAEHVKIIVHSAYIDQPWTGKNIANLAAEISACEEIGADIVVHMAPSLVDMPAGELKAILRSLRGANKNVFIWLEINAAKSSSRNFSRPTAINDLFRKINNDTVGLCVDTAHLHACGVSLHTYDETASWLNNLDEFIPVMFHLNDSTTKGGSGADKHARLCTGKIWGKYGTSFNKKPIEESGVAAIMDYANSHGSIVILERNGKDNSHEDLPADVLHDYFILKSKTGA